MTVLMVDDELRRMESVIEQLVKDGLEVVAVGNVDEALRLIDQRGGDFSCVILDVMMPPGSRFTEAETDRGLSTGTRFFAYVRDRFSRMPIVVLTNYSDEETMAHFEGKINCRFLIKYDFYPAEVSEEVQELIRDSGLVSNG